MSEANGCVRRCSSALFCLLALPLVACAGPVPDGWDDTAAYTEDVAAAQADAEQAGAERAEEVVDAEQVLHMRFPAGTTPEEADEAWQAALADTLLDKATKRDQFYFQISTQTGYDADDGTDGDVHGQVWFRSNRLSVIRGDITMHEDERRWGSESGVREPGSLDRYMFVVTATVKWVAFKKAEISLKGTDGWFLDNVELAIQPWMQVWPASGDCRQWEYPNFWLDNSSSDDWQTYTTPTYSASALWDPRMTFD